MFNLNDLGENVSITVTKKELIEFANYLLANSNNKTDKQSYPKWLGTQQLSEYIGYSVPTIYKKVEAHKIPFVKKGGKYFFNRLEIDNWLAEDKKTAL